MCKECHQIFCPPGCPSYRGFSSISAAPPERCSFCGEELDAWDEYYRFGRGKVCLVCAEGRDIDTLAELCGCHARHEFFSLLGIAKGRI